MDVLLPPLGYVVFADKDDTAQSREDVASFLAYEPLGYVSALNTVSARHMAEAIINTGIVSYPRVDIRRNGEFTLDELDGLPPCVWICDSSYISYLHGLIHPHSEDHANPIKPGGILAFYRNGDGHLCLEPRFKIAYHLQELPQ